MQQKIVFSYDNEITCIICDVMGDNLKEYFDDMFTKELNDFLKVWYTDSPNRWIDVDKFVSTMLVCKIFTVFGYLKHLN